MILSFTASEERADFSGGCRSRQDGTGMQIAIR